MNEIIYIDGFHFFVCKSEVKKKKFGQKKITVELIIEGDSFIKCRRKFLVMIHEMEWLDSIDNLAGNQRNNVIFLMIYERIKEQI